MPFNDNWTHLTDNVLNLYLTNSAIIGISVAIITLLIGVTTAWVTCFFNFPFRKTLSVILILPLAMPAYISAITYVGIFEDSNIIDIRNIYGAIFLISFVLYPYVYLLARSSFLEQSKEVFENSEMLSATYFKIFTKISLPLARPSIALGVTLATLDALADYGTVEFLGVPTFTTGIFRVWFGMEDTISAAQMASVFLTILFVIIIFEKNLRSKISYSESIKHSKPFERIEIKNLSKLLCILICLIPALIGFLIPFSQISIWAFFISDYGWGDEFFKIAFQTLALASLGAFIIIFTSIIISFTKRMRPDRFISRGTEIVAMGYAIPGPVIAIAVLVPLTFIDNSFGDLSLYFFEVHTGQILSGTLFTIIFAYAIRFSAIGIRTIDNGLKRISKTVDESAIMLNITERKLIKDVHMPMMKSSILTGFLIIFVDIMKELPLTSILRPFNFNTLSVKAFELASDEMIVDASNLCFAIVLFGVLPVILIMRNIYGNRNHV